MRQINVHMLQTESITINTAAGPLAGLVHLPDRLPAPAIVCCHGMLSSKDSPKFALIAQELARVGAVALRFDFSGCGESLAELGLDLLSSRLRDLDAVLEYVKLQAWHNGITGLLGSSLGGYLSLLAMSSLHHSIEAAVCWATPFDCAKIETGMEVSEELKRFFPPGFRLGSPQNLGGLPPVKGALIIHGEQDELVPWGDAVRIYEQVGEPKRMLLVSRAEHRFLEPSCRTLALKASIDWFRELGLVEL